MDIKEIAPKLTQKLSIAINDDEAVEFAEALIAEIAKQNEPVAEVNKYHLKGDEHWCKEVLLYSGNNTGDRPENRVKLYTFPPTAEQIANETAEACAKYVNRFINGDGILNEVWISDIESALRNGEWRKFVKEV